MYNYTFRRLFSASNLLLSLFLVGISFLSVNAWPSQAGSVIKKRMKSRLSEIIKLKAKGIIGENNRGYLEFINKAQTKYSKLVNTENADRKKIYELIAKAQSVSINVVEKQRAAQIRKKAPKGVWLQDENGRWYKK